MDVTGESVVCLGPDCHLAGRRQDEAAGPVHSFLGVPFASPPVGDLRFRPPEQLRLWTGVRQATQYGPFCTQEPRIYKLLEYMGRSDAVNSENPMSEDCLYLNIWTPSTEPSAKHPVMVFFHGGYHIGCSNMANGTVWAAQEGFVFVSINFRLSALGFMSTDDAESPGNYGILDQIEALRWVQKYIQNFGGDPDNVTIMGNSSGGRSVSIMLVSDLTRGLFRRAVSLAGVATSAAAVWTEPRSRQYIQTEAKRLGCKSESSKDIVAFLRSLPAENLWNFTPIKDVFSPVVDGHLLKDTPLNLYRKGEFHKVDYMLGFNSHDGAMFVLRDIDHSEHNNQQVVKDYTEERLRRYFFPERDDASSIVQSAISRYFADAKDGTSDAIEAAVQLYGDVRYVASIVDVANMHSEVARTYLCNFCHRLSFSRNPPWVGSDHVDDVQFALGMPLLDYMREKYTEDERELCRIYMGHIAQFARCGDPNGPNLPNWPEYSRQNTQYVKYNGKSEVAREPKKDVVDFWLQF